MLSQLPYHLIHAGEKNVLKQRVFCNYEFLLAKMVCLGFRFYLFEFQSVCILLFVNCLIMYCACMAMYDLILIIEFVIVKLQILKAYTNFIGYDILFRVFIL